MVPKANVSNASAPAAEAASSSGHPLFGHQSANSASKRESSCVGGSPQWLPPPPPPPPRAAARPAHIQQQQQQQQQIEHGGSGSGSSHQLLPATGQHEQPGSTARVIPWTRARHSSGEPADHSTAAAAAALRTQLNCNAPASPAYQQLQLQQQQQQPLKTQQLLQQQQQHGDLADAEQLLLQVPGGKLGVLPEWSASYSCSSDMLSALPGGRQALAPAICTPMMLPYHQQQGQELLLQRIQQQQQEQELALALHSSSVEHDSMFDMFARQLSGSSHTGDERC
jgi:hypothetical protein